MEVSTIQKHGSTARITKYLLSQYYNKAEFLPLTMKDFHASQKPCGTIIHKYHHAINLLSDQTPSESCLYNCIWIQGSLHESRSMISSLIKMLKTKDNGGLTGYMFIKEDLGADIHSEIVGAEIIAEEKCHKDGSVIYILARSALSKC